MVECIDMSCRDRERQQGYHAVGRRNDIRDRAQALIDVGGANGGQLLTRPCPVRPPVPQLAALGTRAGRERALLRSRFALPVTAL